MSRLKILVILANPTYKLDKRGNLLNYICKEFVQVLSNKPDVIVDIIDIFQEKNFNFLNTLEKEPESKVLEFQKKILDSEIVVFFYPVWQGFLPGVLKVFIDRVFSKGFAYNYVKKEIIPSLKDKKFLIFSTTNKPLWYHKLILKDTLKVFWQRVFEAKTGMKLIKFIYFTKIRSVKEKQIENWYKKVIKIADSL